jgi:hypothetical protein
MHILTNGCSFTYGDELDDPSTQAWPHVLESIMNESDSVINLSTRGASNTKILRDTIEYINKDPLEIDMVIIGWTDCTRAEFYSQRPLTNQRYKNYTGPIQVNSLWGDQSFVGSNEFFKDYYKYWQDYSLDYTSWLMQVQLLESYLEEHNIDHKFFIAFGNPVDYEITNKYYFREEHFVGWPNERMVDWVDGLPKCPDGHPGPEAHRLVAEKLLKEIT